jgi:uncharacterized membrane protein YgcG
VTFSDSPADYVILTYNSNLATCAFTSTPNIPLTNSGVLSVIGGAQAVLALAPAESGAYQLGLKCDGADASIACSLNNEMANAQAAVTVTTSSSGGSGSGSSSGGGHGGGGGIGWLELGSLAALLALVRMRPHRLRRSDEIPHAAFGP